MCQNMLCTILLSINVCYPPIGENVRTKETVESGVKGCGWEDLQVSQDYTYIYTNA